MIYAMIDLNSHKLVDLMQLPPAKLSAAPEEKQKEFFIQELSKTYEKLTNKKCPYKTLGSIRLAVMEAAAEEYRAEHEAAANPAQSDLPQVGKVKMVWIIADKMKGAKRAAILDACEAQGIARSTAATQYQKWKTSQPNR